MSPEEQFAKVDIEMRTWRQGDVILGSHLPFMHIFDLSCPITGQAREMAGGTSHADGSFATVATEVTGVVLLTQTCDIVRSAKERPYVEVAPLKEITAEQLSFIRQIPSLARVSSLADRNLAADLDRVVTVEKSVFLSIPVESHISGCATDEDRREFAAALSRKRSRFAFPEDFNVAIKKLRDRIVSKHGKNTFDAKGRPTIEGELIGKIREIRVLCNDWSSDDPNVMFLMEKIKFLKVLLKLSRRNL